VRYNDPVQRARFGWVSALAMAAALMAVGLLLASGPGYRAGWLALGTALQRGLAWGAYAGIAAVVLGGLGIILNARGRHSRAVALAVVALAIGAAATVIPVRWQRLARAVPPIHDITTDTVTPPTFVEVAALRRSLNVPNSLEYAEEVAAQQRHSYPDLAPAFLAVPPADAYRRALDTVRSLGWAVVSEDEDAGRIEATDTTYWFGFKDDVVIRVAALPDGTSRVDVRSVSRVGRSDVGTNARRIRRYLAGLTGPVPGSR
jgi:uncharacterized protein (DUF1499 family)